MRICRFAPAGVGVVIGETVADVTEVVRRFVGGDRISVGDPLCVELDSLVPAIQTALPSAPLLPLRSLKLLSPVARPSKIVGAPINYRDHKAESIQDSGIAHGRNITSIRDWGLFLKAPSSLIGFGEEVRLRFPERRNDYECELTVVIGRECSQVAAANAL